MPFRGEPGYLGTTVITNSDGNDNALTINTLPGSSGSALVINGSASAGAGGGAITLTSSASVAAQPTYRLIDAEPTLSYAGTTTISGSFAAIRGNTTVAADTTISGASYLYGVQGKLTIKGTLSGSAEVSAGLVGQLDLSAATGMTAPLAAIWADCGATAGTVTGADIDAVVVFNTTGVKINSAIRIDTNSTYLFDLTDEGGGHGAGNWFIQAAVGGSNTYKLKINYGGTPYYIPLYTS